MKQLFCMLREIYRTIVRGAPISGHEWENLEEDIHAIVTVSQCKTCGVNEITWKRV